MLIRGIYRISRWGRGLLAWSERRFTAAGGLVLGGCGLALAIGSDVERTLGYQAMVLLLCFMAFAMAMALSFRTRFGFERTLPRFATVGETFRYRVRVRNLTSKSQRGVSYLEVLRFQGPSLREFRERLKSGQRSRTFQLSAPLPSFRAAATEVALIPLLPAGSSIELQTRMTPLRRGPLHLDSACLARPDPFGLFRSLVRASHPQTVWVLPRRYRVPPLALPGRTQYQRGGIAFASGVGESEEFVALREYRRGDSLRRVHWRSTARLGQPIVKEYQDEFFVRYGLVLDTFCDPSMESVFEEAVSVAASFACTVPDQESLLDLLFVGPEKVCVTSGRGVGHAEHMLEVLAAARPCREPRFDDLRELVARHGTALSGCLLVLLGWDAARRQLVRQLKALQVPTWALVLVPPGASGTVRPAAGADRPERFVVIEEGQVQEGLEGL